MTLKPVYCLGATAALRYAKTFLDSSGVPVAESPGWNTGHLLLDVPTFRPGSFLSDNRNLHTLLSSLPRDVTVWGGNLEHPDLKEYHTVDLLQDEEYLKENAAITAHCTLKIAAPLLQTTWAQTPTLVIGWGRIGKCLGALLKSLNCPLTVAVRSKKDREELEALGYRAVDTADLRPELPQQRIVINTVPAPVLTDADFEGSSCVKIDLASQRGIAGEDVLWARGLPGIHAPESSGRLIADTFLRLSKEAAP